MQTVTIHGKQYHVRQFCTPESEEENKRPNTAKHMRKNNIICQVYVTPVKGTPTVYMFNEIKRNDGTTYHSKPISMRFVWSE